MRQKGFRTPKIIWRNGILIESKRKATLIEMLPATQRLSITIRGHTNCKLLTYAVDGVLTLAKWYNVTFTTEIPCTHCTQTRGLWSTEPYIFSLEECETALKEGLSVVYCRGVKPVRIDKLAPDLAMADIADRKVDYSQITIERELGEGSFAKVFKGTYRGAVVAIKQIKKEAQDFGEFRRELWAMSGLNHANVVQLVGFCTVPPCILSEFIPEGNLYELIHDLSKSYSLAFQLRVAMDIAKALRFLHWRLSPPMIHNDLKSPNVLLVSQSEDAEVIAKITDFGLSKQTFQDKRATEEDQGNPRWLAPEALRGEQYSNKLDIYALGVILWEMTAREHFLDHKFMFKIRERVLAGERPAIPEDTIPQLKTLISKCWCDDPKERPDVNYCIETLISAFNEHAPHLLAAATAERPVVGSRTTGEPPTPRRASKDLSKAAPHRPNRIAQSPDTTAQLAPSRRLEQLAEGSIHCMLHAKRFKQVWLGDGSGVIKVLSEDGEVLNSPKCHNKMISCLAWIKPHVWSSSADGTVRVWNKSMSLVKELKDVHASAMVKVENTVWISTFSMVVYIVNKKTMVIEKTVNLPLAKDNVVGSMIYKEPYVWVGTSNAVIRVSADEQTVVDVQGGHTKLIQQFIAVEEEEEIWSCSSDSTICVWDEQTGQCKRVLTGHTGRVFGLTLERSHRSVVWSCSWDKRILVWDVQSKRIVAQGSTEHAHTDAVSCLAQIGGTIWSGSWDRSICQWHTLGLMDVIQSVRSSDFDTFAQMLKTPAGFSTLYASLPKSTFRGHNSTLFMGTSSSGTIQSLVKPNSGVLPVLPRPPEFQ